MALLLLTVCDGGGGGYGGFAVDSVDRITLNPPEPVLGVGRSASLSTVVQDKDGKTLVGSGFKWASSDPAIATVNDKGQVQAVASGVTRVTASVQNHTGTAFVAVSTAILQALPTAGTVSTPAGEVKVILGSAGTDGVRVSIEPVASGIVAGTTVPGTVYRITMVGLPTGTRPTVTVRYSTVGFPTGFDEAKVTLSRKVGAAWVPLASNANTSAKTITTVLSAASNAAASSESAAAESAVDMEMIVGAVLYSFETDIPSLQLDATQRVGVQAHIRSLATGSLVAVSGPTGESTAPTVATVGALSASGNDIGADITAVSSGSAVIRIAGTVAAPSGSEVFGGEITVTVLPQTSLSINVDGLPAGIDGDVTVTGPSGFTRRVTASQSLGVVAQGTYTIIAGDVPSLGQVYVPGSRAQTVTLGPREVRTATVSYAPTRGSLAVQVSGLPGGTFATVSIVGPNEYSKTVTASETISGLAAGAYTVTASNVAVGTQLFAPGSPTQTVSVVAGQTATAPVAYAPASSLLGITINGLPAGVDARVTITGPNDYKRTLAFSETLVSLPPGAYTIAAENVELPTQIYAASPTQQVVTIVAGKVGAASVEYAATVGTLTVAFTGPTAICPLKVSISGPNGFGANITGFQTGTGKTYTRLAPGSYTITASDVFGIAIPTFDPYVHCVPQPSTQVVVLAAGATRSATFNYVRTFPIDVFGGVGTGVGTVVGGGISCSFNAGVASGTCRLEFVGGTPVNLTFSPSPTSRIAEIEHTYEKFATSTCTVLPPGIGYALSYSCTVTPFRSQNIKPTFDKVQ